MKDNDIIFLRGLAIIFIVAHHCMTTFSGWPPNHTITGIEIPSHANTISFILKTFGLSSFTFISGYVLYYQNNKKEHFHQFLLKKIKRILVPCFIWAFLYGILFPDFMYHSWPAIINGTHLWYLPMLFACILITSIDIFWKKSWIYFTILWGLFFALSRILPFRTFGELFHYFPIFISGYLFNKINIKTYIHNQKAIKYIIIFIGWSVYFLPFPIPYIGDIIKNLCFALYAFILISSIRNNKPIYSFTNMLSKNSFFIYLTHQFIINSMLLTVPFYLLNYYSSFTILFLSSIFIPFGINIIYSTTKIFYAIK